MDNAQELRFVRHLFTCVKDELTGRGVDEIIGEGPRDRFHLQTSTIVLLVISWAS